MGMNGLQYGHYERTTSNSEQRPNVAGNSSIGYKISWRTLQSIFDWFLRVSCTIHLNSHGMLAPPEVRSQFKIKCNLIREFTMNKHLWPVSQLSPFSALVTSPEKLFFVGVGCMVTETTSVAQERLRSDALPDTTATEDRARDTLYRGPTPLTSNLLIIR